MSLQKHFENFNDKIRVDYDTKAELAEKRDILTDKLKKNDDLPAFETLNQGSYSMYTGVEPVDGKEYDIDIGLRFDVNKDDYDPMNLKQKVYDILKNHTDLGAEIKKPCVTVTYKKDGEAAYHADLVIYVYEDSDNHDSQLYLARGKNAENAEWEKSDPKGLTDYINEAVEDKDDRKQFRRVIRYLKRWKNIKFDSSGHAEPSSIGITLIAADHFKPSSNNGQYSDLDALISLVEEMNDLFEYECTSESGRDLYRTRYPMPSDLDFGSDTDAFNKMTDTQMTDFKEKAEKLLRDLNAVRDEADEVKQCEKLRKIFGDDFEVPEAKQVSKQQYNFIPASSASGADC